MARTSPAKRPPRRTTPKKKKTRKKGDRSTGMSLGRLFFFLLLLLLFAISIGVVGYVIFFRVVVAAEITDKDNTVVFEVLDRAADDDRELPAVPKDESGRDRVAIIIDDMGYHPALGRELLALDLELTFSFLPHAPFTAEIEEEAYLLGRTVMLHLPLEPHGQKWDPGPGALYISQSPAERRQLLEANLGRVPHATGVNNHMGSRYTESDAPMSELIELFAEHQLFFIDSYTTAHSMGMSLAREKGVPTSRRHVFLDNVQQLESICAQLENLVQMAQKQGAAIGIAHPHPETLEALATCGTGILDAVALVSAAELVH